MKALKIDYVTEKLVDAPEGLRIEGEQRIKDRFGDRTLRWMRYITTNEIKRESAE